MSFLRSNNYARSDLRATLFFTPGTFLPFRRITSSLTPKHVYQNTQLSVSEVVLAFHSSRSASLPLCVFDSQFFSFTATSQTKSSFHSEDKASGIRPGFAECLLFSFFLWCNPLDGGDLFLLNRLRPGGSCLFSNLYGRFLPLPQTPPSSYGGSLGVLYFLFYRALLFSVFSMGRRLVAPCSLTLSVILFQQRFHSVFTSLYS